MADTRLETLSIQINASIGNADKNIRKITASVERLEDCINKTDWEQFNAMERHLRNIASIDFTQVASSLHDVVDAFRALGLSKTTMSFIRDNQLLPKMEDTTPKDVAEPEWQLDMAGLQSLSSNFTEIGAKTMEVNNLLGKSNELIASMTPATDNWARKLAECGLNAKEVEKVLTEKTEIDRSIDFSNLSKVLKELGFSADEASSMVKSLGLETNKAGNQAHKSTSKWKKLMGQIKRIAVYRLIRRALQIVVQAFKEGIQEMAKFDSGFNESMSELLSSWTYLKSSLGTLIAPLVQMITPLLTFLADSLADLANEFGAVFSAMQGKDTFAKATKGAEDYAESLKKAKSASLGIDELNVLQADESKDKFETTAIGEQELAIGKEFGEVLTMLKETFAEIFRISKEITERVPFAQFLTTISNILTSLEPIINVILNLVDLLFDRTEDGVNNSIQSLLNAILKIVNLVAMLVDELSPLFELIINIASYIINFVNSGLGKVLDLIAKLAEKLTTGLQPILEMIMNFLQPLFDLTQEYFDVCYPLIEGMLELLEGVFNAIIAGVETVFEFIKAVFDTVVALWNGDTNKIGDIWGKLGEKLKHIWIDVANFFIDVINGLAEAFENFVNFFVDIGGEIAGWFGADTSDWGVSIGRIEKLSYATGGFPEDGMFFANHNELVGQFSNGKTAVANNEEITQGIYEAVLQAMRETSVAGNNDGGNIVLEIDGREVAKTVKKYNNLDGKEIISGGAKYGY